MALDEVTQICPVPVPSWLADSGGKGIQIITVAHGEAQLRSRWGTNGARVILDTSSAKIWLPGISDPATLDTASALCGTAAMKEARDYFSSRRDDHPDYYARHPIMTAEMIRQLPDRRALVIRGGMSPVIARLPMAWNDRLYRKARRENWAATLAAVPAPEEIHQQPSPEPTRGSGPTWNSRASHSDPPPRTARIGDGHNGPPDPRIKESADSMRVHHHRTGPAISRA
jgi:type IV secretory pathway TraG/TraD family ATPase VirD4